MRRAILEREGPNERVFHAFDFARRIRRRLHAPFFRCQRAICDRIAFGDVSSTRSNRTTDGLTGARGTLPGKYTWYAKLRLIIGVIGHFGLRVALGIPIRVGRRAEPTRRVGGGWRTALR